MCCKLQGAHCHANDEAYLPACLHGRHSSIPLPWSLAALTSSPDSVLHKINLGPHEVHQRSRVYKHTDTILLHKFIKLALALCMSGAGPWPLLDMRIATQGASTMSAKSASDIWQNVTPGGGA